MSRPRSHTGRHVLLTSTASDSHTWNLVYLQLLLEESGLLVTNLGACVPEQLVVHSARRLRPHLILVSSINGHGGADGLSLIRRLRACDDTAAIPTVIGGKLGIGAADPQRARDLVDAGYHAVFEDGRANATALRNFFAGLWTAVPV